MSTADDIRIYREKSTARDDSGPAFPVEIGTRPVGQNWHQTNNNTAQHYGLSLRDYFAAKAMQGLCADPSNHKLFSGPDEAAENAYLIADAMLKARKA
jgi:uncharacterized protein (DUF736 family)